MADKGKHGIAQDDDANLTVRYALECGRMVARPDQYGNRQGITPPDRGRHHLEEVDGA